MPSSRTDFFVDMSGQISSQRRQYNGQEINAVMFWPKPKRWIIGTGRVNSGWASSMPLHSLNCSTFRKHSSLLKAYFIYILFLNESFLFQSSTLLCWQNRIFVGCRIFSKLLFCRQFCRQSACRRQHYMTVNMEQVENVLQNKWVVHFFKTFFGGMWTYESEKK